MGRRALDPTRPGGDAARGAFVIGEAPTGATHEAATADAVAREAAAPVNFARDAAAPVAFAREAADPDCLEPAAATALLAGAPWRRLVVIGDSVAEGIRGPAEGYRDLSFADRVASALGHGRPGFASWNLGRRDLRLPEIRATQLAPALAFEPDVAIVSAGGNDALRRSFDERAIRSGLTALVGQLIERGALVLTAGLFDLARSGLLPDEHAAPMIARFDRLDAVTAEVAAAQGAIHVDNHHHPRAADPAIFAGDRMHANARGHAIAAAETIRALSAAAA